jgi:excisionase family DNA binding protein
VTLAEAARALGLSHATLRWQIRNKKLRGRKMGNLWTVADAEVERYRQEHQRKR